MAFTNHCKKCGAEVPPGALCPRCGSKLARTGEHLTLTYERRPVTDWFSWNAMLRVVVPVIVLALGIVLLIEGRAEGGAGIQAVLAQGFFWTLMLALAVLLAATALMLWLQGTETVRCVLDAKGAHLATYLRNPTPLRFYARLTSPRSMPDEPPEGREQRAEGLICLRKNDLPWAEVRRARYWAETGVVLLYRPRFWLAMHWRCDADAFSEVRAYVEKRTARKRRPRSGSQARKTR